MAILMLAVAVISCSASRQNTNTSAPAGRQTSASRQAAIEIETTSGVTTVVFTDAEITLIERAVQVGDVETAQRLILAKMAEAGTKCCEPRKRLDDCSWRCCDNTIVKTCDERLRAALTQFDQKPQKLQ